MSTTTETVEETVPTKPKRSWKAILLCTGILCLIAYLNRESKSSGGAGNCDCQYKDELGNKKRTHTGSYRDCVDLYRGEWLGDGVDCKVPKYTTF